MRQRRRRAPTELARCFSSSFASKSSKSAVGAGGGFQWWDPAFSSASTTWVGVLAPRRRLERLAEHARQPQLELVEAVERRRVGRAALREQEAERGGGGLGGVRGRWEGAAAALRRNNCVEAQEHREDAPRNCAAAPRRSATGDSSEKPVTHAST